MTKELDALRFHLLPGTKRCFHEDAPKDTLITGEYDLSDGATRTDFKITNHYNAHNGNEHIFFSREHIDKGENNF